MLDAEQQLVVCSPEPKDLLRYLATYQVVVCTACSYAIQPNAIARHLKEIHLLQRAARRPYMDHASKLQLADPFHVLRLEPVEFPVPLLPVYDGFSCTYQECGHLCITEKRMKAHWSSTHGRQGQPSVDFKYASLQTFFKGNLLRYFTGGPAIPKPKPVAEETFKLRSQRTHEIGHCGLPLPPLVAKSYNWANELEESDLFLISHYMTSTYLSISSAEDTLEMWRTNVPRLAQQHSFVLHAILACTALHLAYLNPSGREEMIIKARIHQAKAMPLFRAAIAEVDSKNCHAVLIYTHLLVINSFASEEQDEKLFLGDTEDEETLPSWLFFLRTGCSMLCGVWDGIAEGPAKPLAAAWETPIDTTAFAFEPYVDYFLAVPQEEWLDSERTCYIEAANELARAFSCMNALGNRITTWDAMRIWPMRKSLEYIELLRAWHPGALILLAHFCLILEKLDGYWYFKGRSQRVLSTVAKRLEGRWHRYIEWPLTGVAPLF